MFTGVSQRALTFALVGGLVLGFALFWADGQINQRLGTVEIGIAFGPADAVNSSAEVTSTLSPSTSLSQPSSDEIVESSTTTTSTTTTVALTLPSNVDQMWRDEVLFLTNTERLKEGLDPLVGCDNLHKAAQSHTNAMHEQNFYDHVNPYTGDGPGERANKAGYGWSSIGENAYKSPQSPRAAVRGWMNSPGHRENILGNFEHLGIGITLGGSDTYGDGNWFWWVQKFGTGGPCS